MVRIISEAQAETALELVLLGLRCGVQSAEPVMVAPTQSVVARAAEIATRAKLLPIFVDGIMPALEGETRSWLAQVSRDFKVFTFRTNARLLEHVSTTSTLLSDAGIAHVVYKGPLQQQQIYGSLFHRPSSDIDILVAQADFTATADRLQTAGFQARQNLALWWRVFVGQEHFSKPEFADWSIDLHHRLQEPGVQQPFSSGVFVQAPDRAVLDQTSVPVIQAELLPLISTINFVKGLSRRRNAPVDAGHKMSAAHLADLHQLLEGGDPECLASFVTNAQKHGLKGSAVLALRGLQAVFGMAPCAYQTEASNCLKTIDDRHLAAMILMPEIIRDWPSPGAILRDSWPADPSGFARDFAWYLASEMVRKTYRAGRLTGIYPKSLHSDTDL